MPTLHVQFQTAATASDGTSIAVPPQEVLRQRGPCVQVTVGLAKSYAEELVRQGKAIPAPVSGWGLIDTGASCTCIDESMAQALSLPVIDVVQMSSASHAAADGNVYPAQLEISGADIRIEVPRAVGAELRNQNIIALIGRDVLGHATLFYNGIAGQITLSIL